MKLDRQVASMLKRAGFVLARKNRHYVYKRGRQTVTVAISPRSGENVLEWVRQDIARCDRELAQAA